MRKDQQRQESPAQYQELHLRYDGEKFRFSYRAEKALADLNDIIDEMVEKCEMAKATIATAMEDLNDARLPDCSELQEMTLWLKMMAKELDERADTAGDEILPLRNSPTPTR